MSDTMKRIRNWVLWTLATIGLGLVVLVPDGTVHALVNRYIGMDRAMAMPWIALYIDHAVMTLVALALIALLSQGRFGEFGLQRPRASPTSSLRLPGEYSSGF
jgi:hypothetical protein